MLQPSTPSHTYLPDGIQLEFPFMNEPELEPAPEPEPDLEPEPSAEERAVQAL